MSQCTVNVDTISYLQMVYSVRSRSPIISKYTVGVVTVAGLHRQVYWHTSSSGTSRIVVEEIVEHRRVRHVVDDHHEVIWNIIRYRVDHRIIPFISSGTFIATGTRVEVPELFVG